MSNINILSNMSKDDIKKALKEKSMKRAHLELDLDNPKTVQEKITWLMIYDDAKFKLKSKCADKILLHEYCKKKLGEDICIPILKVYDDPNDIDFNELPNKFVLKCNHGYAMNILVDKEKNKYTTLKKYGIKSEDDCKEKLREWLGVNFGDINYQWHYALIEPKCYAEEFMDDGNETLTDYKVWCCNGEPKMIQVISNRYTNNLHANVYDTEWNWFNLGWNDFKEDPDHKDPKPKELDKMLSYAKTLSKDFTFVRVDFYIIKDKLYLGELTFSPDGGIFRYKDRDTELYWGEQIKLKSMKEDKSGVSICITAYKSENYIKDCLDSVVSQTWFDKHDNYEILLGIDGCQDTLSYIRTIYKNYKNLRVLMMDSNMGTYVTTNTLLSVAKYDNIIRFDSDDIMLPNLVEYVMKNKGDSDIFKFKMKNFGINRNTALSDGVCYYRKSLILKYGGYQPWKCGADSELKKRLEKFAKILKSDEILFLRRTHDESLTRKRGDTCIVSGNVGSYREEKLNYVRKLVVTNEKDATIKFVVNTFKELKPSANKNVVYTCITDGYDCLDDPTVVSSDFDYVCFTDSITKYNGNVWSLRPIPDELKSLTAVKQQRIIKICPHKYLPDYDLSVWVDANIDILIDMDKFLMSNCSDESKSVFMPYHPTRDCIYKEGPACVKYKKETKDVVDSLMTRYKKEGFPDNYGLVQSGIIIRRHNDPYCVSLMDLWAKEVVTNSHRDQLSFNYCLWLNGDQGFVYLPSKTIGVGIFKVHRHGKRKHNNVLNVVNKPNSSSGSILSRIKEIQQNSVSYNVKTFILDNGYSLNATKYKEVFKEFGDVEIVKCDEHRFSNGYKRIIDAVNSGEYRYIISIRSNVNLFGISRIGEEIIRKLKSITRGYKNVGIYTPSFNYASGVGNPSVRKQREGERCVDLIGDGFFILDTSYVNSLPVYDFSRCPSGHGFVEILCDKVAKNGGKIIVDDSLYVSSSYMRTFNIDTLEQHRKALFRYNADTDK